MVEATTPAAAPTPAPTPPFTAAPMAAPVAVVAPIAAASRPYEVLPRRSVSVVFTGSCRPSTNPSSVSSNPSRDVPSTRPAFFCLGHHACHRLPARSYNQSVDDYRLSQRRSEIIAFVIFVTRQRLIHTDGNPSASWNRNGGRVRHRWALCRRLCLISRRRRWSLRLSLWFLILRRRWNVRWT